MKKARIVSIGNELLSGTIVDTNTAWLCARLLELGIPVIGGCTAPDEMDRITEALRHAMADADIVLVTGGLGPTDDDLTRQAMAEVFGVRLRLLHEAEEQLKAYFAVREISMPDRNIIQAYIPEGAAMLHNSIGTAPGIWWQAEGKVVAAMPGVPAEMMEMFKEEVEARLAAMADGYIIKVRKLHCFGIGESAIAQQLGDLMRRGRNPLINTTANVGAVTLYIVAMAENAAETDRMVKADEAMLRKLLGDYIYGADGQTLAEVTGQALRRAGKKIVVAESCTGGMLAGMITDVPGSSEYFLQGWVTYSDESKTRELGVPPQVLARYGAVSAQVAEAMAKGARERSGADVAVGITGIAGPGGGTDPKPVGLVYISVETPEGVETRQWRFMRGRQAVRLRAALTALDAVRRKL